MVLLLVGDNAILGEWVDQLVAVTTEQGFPYWRAQGTIYRGWVKVKNGDVVEGISLLRSGSTAYRATGAESWTPYYIALLARACEIAGQIEEALTLLDDALQIAGGQGSVGSKRSYIGKKASCCCGKGIPRPPRNCIGKP